MTVIGDSQGGIAVPILRSRGYDVVDLHRDGARVEGTCRSQVGRIGRSDLVVVFLGSNHYDDGRSPNVRCVLDAIPEGSRCIWVGPPFIRDGRYRFEDELRESVASRCTYVSLQDIRNMPDRIHPRGRSATLMVDNIVNKI